MVPADPVPGCRDAWPTGSAQGGTAADRLRVEVAYCPGPGAADVVTLELPVGAVAADAVASSGLLQRHGLQPDGLRVGIWCRPCEATTLLRDRDRVEIYRPLTVDPKEARRLRYKRGRTART
jgi:putative ubiquitin-RnfH superfamily antitoxin RatB of RatAB toxin-antitoxin module